VIPHADHFASAEHESDAAHLAVWVLVASEMLLFAGLFALYAAMRVAHPVAFRDGVGHMALALGTTNTFLLLTSSLTAALAVFALKEGRRGLTLALTAATMLLGLVFLALKGAEYADHLHHGLGPDHAVFFTLYYLMTGLHALHVIGGLGAFSWASVQVLRGRASAERPHPFELVTVYWHFVDLVWIFLWPAFYLTGGGGS